MKKILISSIILFSFIFISSYYVKALTINNDELANPNFLHKNYIIVYVESTENYYAINISDKDTPYIDNNKISVDLKGYLYTYKYNKNKNEWENSSSIMPNRNWSFSYTLAQCRILMTNVDIYDFNKQNILYEAGYGLDVKPTLDISSIANKNENGIVTSYDLKFSFSEWDTDKYYYQYSYDGKSWASIKQQDFILNVNQNITVFGRIMNRKTNEYVNTASMTIAGISPDTLPKIKFEIVTNDVLEGESCYVTKNGKDYIICEVIEYTIENYDERHHDIYYRGIHDLDFKETTYNSRHLYSENGTFVVKVVDRTTHQILTAETMTISSISPFKDLGIYHIYDDVFYKENYAYELRYTFYNFDPDLHKMYYSIDSPNENNFQEITDYIYNSESGLTYKNFEFFKDSVLFIKIDDLEGNRLYSFSTTVDYEDILSKNEDTITREIRKFLKPFYELIDNKFPIVNQLGEIIKSFSYDKENRPRPSLIINFSFLGGKQYELFSDDFINAYESYRDVLYFFIYLAVGFVVIPKTLGYVKGWFGGGDNA